MSQEFHVQCDGHSSVYARDYRKNNYQERKFNLYYSLPDLGVNFNTGILLFIAGFDGNSNSNVYKKMRRVFADKYNLVTIQCDYFGYEFMEKPDKFKLSVGTELMQKLLKILPAEELLEKTSDINLLIPFCQENNIDLLLDANLNETLSNFADMSYMQAIDNITAVLKVIDIIYKDGKCFNTKKVILYGFSQGAYLSYLCNRFTKNLFTHLLDNSSWIYPHYLNKGRLFPTGGYKVIFNYYSQSLKFNLEFLKINYLYKNFENTCKIIVYHGRNDNFNSYEEKVQALEQVKNITFNLITKEGLPNDIFKSDRHGLDTDFLNLFDDFYKKYVDDEQFSIEKKELTNFNFKNDNLKIIYSQNRPLIMNLVYKTNSYYSQLHKKRTPKI